MPWSDVLLYLLVIVACGVILAAALWTLAH
jgi:hypothetical protein